MSDVSRRESAASHFSSKCGSLLSSKTHHEVLLPLHHVANTLCVARITSVTQGVINEPLVFLNRDSHLHASLPPAKVRLPVFTFNPSFL